MKPEMKTLPDYLAPDLDIVSIGINPSPVSVELGFPFASTRNRFWRVLNNSNLVAASRPPSIQGMHQLLKIDRIGFTDLVKRPTKSANDLNAADFRAGAATLQKKLTQYRPKIIWFQGMTAVKPYFKYVAPNAGGEVRWGRNPTMHGNYEVFVSPNPSSANAAFSEQDLLNYFNQLADLRMTQGKGGAS